MNKLFINPLLISATVFGTVLSSCSNDDPDPSPQPEEAGFVIATTAGSFPSETSYLQALASLDLEGQLDNSNATELNGTAAVMEPRGAHVYVGRFGDPARLYKFHVNENHTLTQEGVIQVDGASTFSGLLISSETEGYCLPFGVDKVIRFNPDSFGITGEIDLSGIQKQPYTMLKSGMVLRDGKLYIPIEYKDYSTYSSPLDATFVAVVDLAGETVQLIEDDRTKDNENGDFPVIIKDQQDNIYIQTKGEPGVLPGGILRIKSGEEDFDPDYFFDLNEATGSERVIGLSYLKENTAVTAVQTRSGDVFFEPVYSYYRLDLDAQEAENIPGIPENNAYRSGHILRLDDDRAMIPAESDAEHALYEYNISTGSVQKKLIATSRIARLVSLK